MKMIKKELSMCNKTPELEEYLNRVVHKLKEDAARIENGREAIHKLLNKTASIVGVHPQELFRIIFQDIENQRAPLAGLESFIAELNAIDWLNDYGFKCIKPIKRLSKKKRPDFSAKFKNLSCEIEVFCLTHNSEKLPHNNLGFKLDLSAPSSRFQKDVIKKFQEKGLKFKNSSEEVKIKLVLCVINRNLIAATYNLNELEELLKIFWEKLKIEENKLEKKDEFHPVWSEGYYLGFCIFKAAGKHECIIYPLLK